MKTLISEIKREQAFGFAKRTALKLMEDLDTPRSLCCYLLIKNDEWQQYIDLELDPLNYQSAWNFGLDYQATSFLKKAEFLPLEIDRSKVALAKFLEAEAMCAETNEKLRDRMREEALTATSLSKVLYLASSKIASWLGNCPCPSTLQYTLGPGATSTCRGSDTSVANKLGSKAVVYKSAESTYRKSIETLPHLVASSGGITDVCGPFSSVQKVYVQEFNELFFVPKSAKTDRAICVEPHSMPALQRGYGLVIRRSLLKAGIDLQKQQRVNAALAKEGSVNGTFATIDLSAASDTISISLVAELLPMEWFLQLGNLRAPYTKLPDGSFIENEKFSSMGNGFTFELETLVFASLAHAVKDVLKCEGQISVFGDDIIVPSAMAKDLIKVLTLCGFKTNKEKTFVEGPFRESCGSDYFNGQNVRPYFYKEQITYETDKFKIANGIRHFAYRCFGNGSCYSGLRRTWSHIVKSIPENVRCFGPAELGDQVLWSDRGSCSGNYSMQYGTIRIHKTAYWQSRSENLSRFDASVILSTALYGSSSRISIRGLGRPVLRYKPITIHKWDWLDGEWA